MPLGTSFAPLNDPMRRDAPAGPVPIQEAIKVLSLRLPRVSGASAPTPSQLLAGMPGAGTGAMGGPTSNPIIEQLLRALFGGRQQSQIQGLPGAPDLQQGGQSFSPFPGFRFAQAPSAPMPSAPPTPAPAPTSGARMGQPPAWQGFSTR